MLAFSGTGISEWGRWFVFFVKLHVTSRWFVGVGYVDDNDSR
jgi:hypothetical protein